MTKSQHVLIGYFVVFSCSLNTVLESDHRFFQSDCFTGNRGCKLKINCTIPELRHAHIIYSNLTGETTTKLTQGDSVYMKCDTGYSSKEILPGQELITLTCESNGEIVGIVTGDASVRTPQSLDGKSNKINLITKRCSAVTKVLFLRRNL